MKYILIFALFFLYTNSASAKNICANGSEKLAFDIRAAQSYLMVSALSCGWQKDYNNFVKRFSSQLVYNNSILKKYFDRSYNKNSESHLNKFITNLANESSKQSLSVSLKQFCKESNGIFKQALSTKPSKIKELAANPLFTNLHKIKQCN